MVSFLLEKTQHQRISLDLILMVQFVFELAMYCSLDNCPSTRCRTNRYKTSTYSIPGKPHQETIAGFSFLGKSTTVNVGLITSSFNYLFIFDVLTFNWSVNCRNAFQIWLGTVLWILWFLCNSESFALLLYIRGFVSFCAIKMFMCFSRLHLAIFLMY